MEQRHRLKTDESLIIKGEKKKKGGKYHNNSFQKDRIRKCRDCLLKPNAWKIPVTRVDSRAKLIKFNQVRRK